VLRCIIDDGGPNGEVIIHIDEQELSLREFGRLLSVHSGWGMRIAFVPKECITENPTIKFASLSGGRVEPSSDRSTGVAMRMSGNPGGANLSQTRNAVRSRRQRVHWRGRRNETGVKGREAADSHHRGGVTDDHPRDAAAARASPVRRPALQRRRDGA
jgi:hypothetical protein